MNINIFASWLEPIPPSKKEYLGNMSFAHFWAEMALLRQGCTMVTFKKEKKKQAILNQLNLTYNLFLNNAL